jgi:uncharacterized protein
MYTRDLKPPKSAFFLFGPRSVGKSTWLRQQFKDALFIDLLLASNMIRYAKDPSYLVAQVTAEDPERWIVIDEVQKVPALLNEVHYLIENHGYKKMILCGSSARKLRHGASNLLAGRAVTKTLFPFTAGELNDGITVQSALQYGMMPLSHLADTDEEKEAFLNAYVETYITQEIKAEGLVRNIGAFSRFLDLAVLCAGTQPNVSSLARDSGIGRDTVASYFEIFEDTLLGSWLPAYRPRAKIKERSRPKFYWFDTGVLNAAAGAFKQPMPADWQGVLLEHWVHHELKAYLNYTKARGSLGFWRTASGTEVDFIWWYGKSAVAVEVKSSKTFRRSYLKGIKSLGDSLDLHASYIVYLGDEILRYNDTEVLPVREFLRRLHSGDIISRVLTPPGSSNN